MPPDLTRRQVLGSVATACGTAVTGTSTAGATTETATNRRTDAVDPQDDLVTVVRDAVERAIDDYDADGATVGLVTNGDTALTEGYGHTYLNPDVPVDPDETLFRIGSVSKVPTYVAAMRLVDEGRLDPHAPVSDSLTSVSVPDADEYEEAVTLAHLATHTAGFETRYSGQWRLSPRDLLSLPEALRANDPERIHAPGELPMYTNYNAGLAGQLVADVLGTTFESAVQRLVFDPLEMTGSTFAPLPEALVGGRSNVAGEINWFHQMTPAAGMSATASDMATLLEALVGDGAVDSGRVLSSDAVEELHRQWYTPHGQLAGVSFGMARRRRGGTLVVGHSGFARDFRTNFELLPEEGTGLFVSAHGTEAAHVQDAVTEAFLDHVAPVSKPQPSADGTVADADAVAGTYRETASMGAASVEKVTATTRTPTSVRITDSGGLVTERGGTTDRWTRVAPLVFRRIDGEDTLVFREAPDGGFYLFRASTPRTTIESVPWHGQVGVHGQLALVAGLTVLSGAITWPLAAVWRYVRDRSAPPDAVSRSRWTVGASVLALVTFGVLGVVGLSNRWLYARPQWFELLFALPVLGALLALGAAGFTLRAWREQQGSLRTRIHLVAVLGGLAALYSLMWYWNLLQVPL